MATKRNFTGDTRNYIAPFEVVVHNTADDCWVSFLGKVLDVTPLVQEYADQDCIKPILARAGKDISDWFDSKTGDIQHYIHAITGARVPYCPNGRIPHVELQIPSTAWKPLDKIPWWKDNSYKVGLLTKRVRPLRIINTITCQEVKLDVCAEDTIARIMERYSMFNSDPESYTWKCNDRNLDVWKTLEENGISDDRDNFAKFDLAPSLCTPVILLYYDDDFKYYDE